MGYCYTVREAPISLEAVSLTTAARSSSVPTLLPFEARLALQATQMLQAPQWYRLRPRKVSSGMIMVLAPSGFWGEVL